MQIAPQLGQGKDHTAGGRIVPVAQPQEHMTLTDKEPAQIRVVHPNGPDPRPVQHKGQHQKQEKKQALPVEDQLHCLLNISSPQGQHRNRYDGICTRSLPCAGYTGSVTFV